MTAVQQHRTINKRQLIIVLLALLLALLSWGCNPNQPASSTAGNSPADRPGIIATPRPQRQEPTQFGLPVLIKTARRNAVQTEKMGSLNITPDQFTAGAAIGRTITPNRK
jgi:hypothetical protein